jgi:hypothetical protein
MGTGNRNLLGGDETSERLSLADFEKDEKGRIKSSPMGEKASTCENKAGSGYYTLLT